MMHNCEILILGGGFSGLSTSYHIGHEKCVVLEKNSYPFGHCASHADGGVMWDEGPHVSFTKQDYVRSLFEQSVGGEFSEYAVQVGNYYKGSWVDHPAQVNLYQVPEPLRSECLESFLSNDPLCNDEPANYQQWLDRAFGAVFAREFASAYTKKYWTCEPKDMDVSWVGERIYSPNIDDVVEGSKQKLADQKHYITHVRYPKKGGYEAFGAIFMEGASVKYNHNIELIDLDKKEVTCSNGVRFSFEKLISTIPLPLFVQCCEQKIDKVLQAANELSCTSGYLVNVIVPHQATRPENWIYIYDDDFLSTRITFAEKLDGGEVEKDYCALQVEVYHSKYRDLHLSKDEIADKVIDELFKMKLIDSSKVDCKEALVSHVNHFTWGNVIFDHQRTAALNTILAWLEKFGLERELDDLDSSTDWNSAETRKLGSIVLAGRFAQWKYYWSDDCVMRGKMLGMCTT